VCLYLQTHFPLCFLLPFRLYYFPLSVFRCNGISDDSRRTYCGMMRCIDSSVEGMMTALSEGGAFTTTRCSSPLATTVVHRRTVGATTLSGGPRERCSWVGSGRPRGCGVRCSQPRCEAPSITTTATLRTCFQPSCLLRLPGNGSQTTFTSWTASTCGVPSPTNVPSDRIVAQHVGRHWRHPSGRLRVPQRVPVRRFGRWLVRATRHGNGGEGNHSAQLVPPAEVVQQVDPKRD
jgi:hypothetical protein